MNTRRHFLKNGLLAGLAGLTIPKIAEAAVKESNSTNKNVLKLKDNAVILFQGDSITDAGRNKASSVSNAMDQLGTGYTIFTAAHMLEKYAAMQPKIYNRGISGNKVFQLRDRWEIDALTMQPDVISILIGVNDYWHTLTSGYKGTAQSYREDYDNLLSYTKEKLPNVQLVVGEPFVLEGGSAIDSSRWFPKFTEYRVAAKEMADKYGAIFVPYQSAFDKAAKVAPARYWASDGVHPGLPGCQLMASTWLEATGLR